MFKLLTTLLVLSAVLHVSMSYTCDATNYCQSCNSNSQCTACYGKTDDDIGPRTMASNACANALASSSYVDTNSDQVEYYIGHNDGSSWSISSAICKSGYYGVYDAGDDTFGCIDDETSPVSDNESGMITNCKYQNLLIDANDNATWYCAMCSEGYAPDSTNNDGTDCSADITVSNCKMSAAYGECSVCESGYAVYNESSCVSSSFSDQCREVNDSSATECMECQMWAYFDGTDCVASAYLIGKSFLAVSLMFIISLFSM